LNLRLRRCVAEKVLQPSLAAVLAGLVLFAGILSSSPSLHEWFHSESSSPSHSCVICQFAHGQVGMADVTVGVVAFASALCFALTPLSRTVFSPFDYRLSPSRAPPRG
jgi:hypothetical protein